jgi:hypothetical protein
MTDNGAVIEMTRDEIAEMLEAEAQRRRCLPASVLLRQYRAGQLDQLGDVADLIALSNLLPEHDPLLAERV